MKKLKKIIVVLLSFVMIFISGCSAKNTTSSEPNNFDEALASAKGKTVTFYGWGGDPATNKWLDEVVGKSLKEKYDINLKRVPMNIDEILNKLSNEKQANSKSGDIDVVWINGENFYTAKNNKLLYGPITDKITNFTKYIDTQGQEANYDFGNKIDGMEVPYGKAQLVFIGDTAKVKDLPTSTEKLLAFAKENKGKFTYPAPPDFTGSAFVRNVIYDIVGYDAIYNAKADKEEIYKVIKPAFDYLNELEKYLWEEGRTYPKDNGTVDKMYMDGQSLITMSYTPLYAAQKISSKEFTETSQTFVFDKGNIGNTHYMAVPFNAPNKDAALVLINHIISSEMQTTKYDVKNWGDLPVFDVNKLSSEEKAALNNIDNGKGILTPEELFSKRKPEIQAEKVAIIEKLWEEKVLKE
ncbi:ABC transporter substrate-binding protein [Clostridium sp.]|uniref:ABC transporter substrate-binding protein n=1 Tax=Clostridium sp. TaxID=1506 RepID=UPI002FC7E115